MTVNWAKNYIAALQRKEMTSFRPRGHSMSGKIESGQLVTLRPIDESEALSVGDIVLCKVQGNIYLHLIRAIRGSQYQIGNNRGFVNGWTNRGNIFGKCIQIEP